MCIYISMYVYAYALHIHNYTHKSWKLHTCLMLNVFLFFSCCVALWNKTISPLYRSIGLFIEPVRDHIEGRQENVDLADQFLYNYSICFIENDGKLKYPKQGVWIHAYIHSTLADWIFKNTLHSPGSQSCNIPSQCLLGIRNHRNMSAVSRPADKWND